MNKNSKQIAHIRPSSVSLKRIATLSFLAALQLSSCISGKRQRFTGPQGPHAIDASYLLLNTDDLHCAKDLKRKTRDMLFQYAPDLNGQSALRTAISKGDLASVTSLLNGKNIDPNAVGNGLTALAWALKCKQEKIFYALLADQDINIRTPDGATGLTPLHLAIMNGWAPGVRWLATHLDQEDLSAKDKKGMTALDLTMNNARKDLFMLLVDKSAAEALGAKDENDSTLLHICIKSQLIDLAELLIHKLRKEDLYQKDKAGMTPLHLAVKHLPKDTIMLLVNKLPVEALLSADDKGRTPLHLAARIKKKNAFKIYWIKLQII